MYMIDHSEEFVDMFVNRMLQTLPSRLFASWSGLKKVTKAFV